VGYIIGGILGAVVMVCVTGLLLILHTTLAAISSFMDTGHVGPWGALYLAGMFLILYFAAIFALLSGVLWIARRYAPDSISVPDYDRNAPEL